MAFIKSFLQQIFQGLLSPMGLAGQYAREGHRGEWDEHSVLSPTSGTVLWSV